MNNEAKHVSKKYRNIAGILLAAAALLIFGIWYSWYQGLLFAGLFLGAGFLHWENGRPVWGFLLRGLWGIVCIGLCCCAPTWMVSSARFLDLGWFRAVMNFLCVAAVFGVCLALTGRISSAVVLASVPLMVLATVSTFVFQFRGNLLKPMDLFAVGTAMNVVGQYTFRVSQSMAFCWTSWVWLVFSMGVLPSEEGLMPRLWLRLGALAAATGCLAVFAYGTRNIAPNNWSNEGATRNGYFLNFAVGIRDCFVEEPEGYSPETIALLEQEYTGETQWETEKKPNIIVIMNESYADFSILGSELRTNLPVTPFADSLRENTIRGYALTSIFGGTTANAEFEFLTGFSMSGVPEGSCPYQQYINSPVFSLAHLLDSYGYRTFATHPYFASGWNRTAVYPRLGFAEMTFDEDYPYQDLVREFVSDRELYEYVLKAVADKGEEPLFLFGISMQNHGDYIYTGENYTQTISLEGYEMAHPMAEQYLSLLWESDQAMEGFLKELEKLEEDTVLLFFGDHFPQVEGDFFEEVHGGPFETLSEQQLQYSVPFFLWANYDIPEQTVPCTSLNYLGRYLLETAGLELSPYYRFLKELETRIPAVNALGYYSLSQQTYLPISQAEGEEADWLNRYAALQYNGLFDRQGSSDIFFRQYLPET